MTSSKGNMGFIIKWAVVIVAFVGIMMIPETELLTFAMKWFLATTVACIIIIALEMMPMVVPAAGMPLLWSIPGFVPWEVSFSGWSSSVFWLLWGTFLLTEILDDCGLMKRISLWCIRRFGGTYTGTMWGLLFTGIVLNIVTSGGAYVLIFVLGCSLIKALGISKDRLATNIMIVVASVAGMGVVYNIWFDPFSLTVFTSAVQKYVPGYEFYWYDMVILKAPAILLVFAFIFGLQKVFKTQQMQLKGGKEYFDEELRKLGPLNAKEKKAAVILIAVVVYALTSPFTGMNMNYAFMIAPLVCFFPGIEIAKGETFKRLDFALMIFIASCMGIASAATYCGASQLIAALGSELLGGLGGVGLSIATLFTGTAANFLLTPVAMRLLFPDILVQLALSAGINPMPVLIALNMSCDVLFLPHEAGAYLLLMGYGLISMKDFVKWIGARSLIFAAFYILILFPLWSILGVYAPIV